MDAWSPFGIDARAETIFAFDYRAYEAGYDLEGNVSLHAGDVIIVPERGLFE